MSINRYRFNEKTSTQVKEYHLNDAAIQRWVIEGAGYPLKATVISHIDSKFVYSGGRGSGRWGAGG
jgi:hypothetical protein